MDRQAQLEFILDHYQNPRNRGALSDAHMVASWGNPGCADTITIYVREDGQERIGAITFEGEGCTISQASASVLTQMVPGMSLEETEAMGYDDLIDTLGREVVMARPLCATLSLDVLKIAVRKYRLEKMLEESRRLARGDAGPGLSLSVSRGDQQ